MQRPSSSFAGGASWFSKDSEFGPDPVAQRPSSSFAGGASWLSRDSEFGADPVAPVAPVARDYCPGPCCRDPVAELLRELCIPAIRNLDLTSLPVAGFCCRSGIQNSKLTLLRFVALCLGPSSLLPSAFFCLLGI